MQKSMMLIKSTWNQGKTFRLIPINVDCPYNEAIYDPEQKILAVISKECKETFQMVPKFDDKGDVMQAKRVRENGKQYAEERRALDTWYEYYVEDVDDIKAFIEWFAGAESIATAATFIDAPKVSSIVSPSIFEGPTTM
jgi:hypothetical protein